MAKIGERLVYNPLKPMFNRLPYSIRNRYILVLLLFILWMLIFDKADIITQFKLQRSIKRLEHDKIFYQNKLKEVQQEKTDMHNDMEKFAREHYYMKRPDEDVFVIDK